MLFSGPVYYIFLMVIQKFTGSFATKKYFHIVESVSNFFYGVRIIYLKMYYILHIYMTNVPLFLKFISFCTYIFESVRFLFGGRK